MLHVSRFDACAFVADVVALNESRFIGNPQRSGVGDSDT